MNDVDIPAQKYLADTALTRESIISKTECLEDIFSRTYRSIFKKRTNAKYLFFTLVKKIGKYFGLSKAVLIVKSGHDETLKVIAIKGRKTSRDGLALILPRKNSHLYEVINSRQILILNQADDFPGNFIEKKLLYDDAASTAALCPIMHDGQVYGLLCLISPDTHSFDNLTNGLLDKILNQFGAVLRADLSRLGL